MGDTSLIPISDEQAKLGQDLVNAVRDASGYFTNILGDIPKDLIGLLIGDRVKAKRIERIAVLWQRSRERLRDRGVGDREPPSLKLRDPDFTGCGRRGERGVTRPLVAFIGCCDGPEAARRDAPVVHSGGQADGPDGCARSQSDPRGWRHVLGTNSSRLGSAQAQVLH
jgi:hypothetical protein